MLIFRRQGIWVTCRREGRLVATIVAAAALALGAGGCAGPRLAAHAIKSAQQADQPGGGSYKVGRPYRVDGVTYVPRVDPAYDEVGMASWYGAEFHGKRTANGDVFDMNALSAAHKTLPMPSRVRVTNLENGRMLVVTVNDRGPFVRGRIIDLSRRAAQLLGFEGSGVAKVRVEVLPGDGERLLAERTPVRPTVAAAVSVSAVAPPPAPPKFSLIRSAAAAEPVDPAPRLLFIQGGAFRHQDNAARLADALSAFGPTRITAVELGGRILYRVRLGPLYDRDQARGLLARVAAAGHSDARIVGD
jgi:rare lipoprotein A